MSRARSLLGARLDRRSVGRAAIARLAVLIGNGIPVGDAVEVGAAGGGAAGALISRLARGIARGQRFSQALARTVPWLSPGEIALVAAGERAGDLGRGVALLDSRLEQRARARSGLSRALLYPIGMLAVTLVVTAAMASFVLPAFVAMYQSAGMPVPWATRTVITAGGALTTHGPAAATALLAGATLLAWLRRRSRSFRRRHDAVVLRLPLVGTLLLTAQKAQLYATLAALLEAGVDVEAALSHASPVAANLSLRRSVERTRALLGKGASLSAAIGRSGLDPLGSDSALLRIAEATGDYGACFARLAAAAAAARDERLQQLTRAIEPLTVCVMALVVGATALGLYQPVLGAGALLQGGVP